MFAELSIGIADPVERLAAILRHMRTLTASHEVDASEARTPSAGSHRRCSISSLRSATAAVRRVPQRNVNTVTTNVPRPPDALYALGRELLEYLPFVRLAQGVRIGVAIRSYRGVVRLGVTTDFDTVREVAWFCQRIEAGVADLAERTGSAASGARE